MPASEKPENESRSLGDVLFDLLARFEVLWLVLLLALVSLFALVASHHKRLWYDELFTVIVATQPSWHRFLQAMPPEGNPPMGTLLTRLSIDLLGVSPFAVRMPALLSFLAALVGLYVFVRRECGGAFALLAVVLMISEPAWTYSFEARPYGLLLAFLMLALVSWQAATTDTDAAPPRPRTWALAGMVIGIVGSMLSHYIGMMEVGVPLILGEAVRSYRRRRFDWPVISTGLCAIPALAIILPMMHRTNVVVIVHSPLWQSAISVHQIAAYGRWAMRSWDLVLATKLLGTLAVLVLVTWAPEWLQHRADADRTEVSRMDAGSTRRPIQPHILAAALGATLLIPFTWFGMIFAHGWYFCRYGIGTAVGVSVLACLLLARRPVQSRIVVVLLMLWLTGTYARAFVSEWHQPAPTPPYDQIVYGDASGLPIVVTNPLEYPAIWWYAPAAVKSRVVYLGDPYSAEVRFAGETGVPLVEATLMAERSVISAPLEDYPGFLGAHRHFLLYVDGSGAGLKKQLESAGCALTPVRSSQENDLYDVRCGSVQVSDK